MAGDTFLWQKPPQTCVYVCARGCVGGGVKPWLPVSSRAHSSSSVRGFYLFILFLFIYFCPAGGVTPRVAFSTPVPASLRRLGLLRHPAVGRTAKERHVLSLAESGGGRSPPTVEVAARALQCRFAAPGQGGCGSRASFPRDPRELGKDRRGLSVVAYQALCSRERRPPLLSALRLAEAYPESAG